MSRSAVERAKRKKTFCGKCIQERLHRGDESYDFDKEYGYESKPMPEEVRKYFRLFLGG
jgi:hypothetical protein